MATNNSRDVRLSLSVETLGAADIQTLRNHLADLAKEGGDAAPEFQRLADELGRIADQAQALQAFQRLSEETATLSQRQEQASATVTELRAKLDALSATTQEAVERQRSVAAALDDARQAQRAARDELATLTATTDRAGKGEAEYAAQVERLKLAKIEQRAEIERLSASLAQANAEVKLAEKAEAALTSQYDRANNALTKVSGAVAKHEADMRDAANAAAALGVSTDNIAAEQAELAQAFARTSGAANELEARIQRLAEREKELAGIRAFEKQFQDAQRLLQTAEYARLFDEALKRLSATEQRIAQQNADAKWQREAEALVNAAHAAQELARETAVLEAAQRELAAQAAFKKQADEAREMLRAAEYVRFWREELDKAEAQAKRTADEARLAAERISNAFGAVGVRSAQELQQEITEVRAAMETLRNTAGLTGAQLNTAFAAGEAKIAGLERELRQLNGTLTTADRLSGLLKNSMGQIAAGNLIADGIGYLVNKVKELGVEFVRTIAQTEATRRALMAIYKDAGVAASQFQFLKDVANQAGVAVGTIQQAFVRFSAATQASGIGLETTNRLFAEVTRAAGTLGLSGEQVTGMLEALAQMASKGTVSMEELRQQLGDRLPGALSLVAKGLGLTEAQLIKLVESGGLAARDLFPALTKALGEMRGETEGLIPTYERFKNVLKQAAEGAGDAGWAVLLTGALKILGGTVGALALGLNVVMEAMFLTGKAAVALAASLRGDANAWGFFSEEVQKSTDRLALQANTLNNMLEPSRQAAQSTTQHAQAMQDLGTAAAQATEGAITTSRAQEAQAKAAALAADSSIDLGSKLVQLKAFIDEKLSSQEKEIEASERLAKAAKIEGDSLVKLAEIRGGDFNIINAQVEATNKYADAMDKAAVAQRAETELLIIKRDEIVRTAIAQEGNLKARQQEIAEIDKKIVASRSETEQSEQAAAAARQEANARQLAAQTYRDNSKAVEEYRRAMENANMVVDLMTNLEREGVVTKDQLAQAQRDAAAATHLYNDAVQDSVAAIELESRVRDANNNLIITGLEIQARNYESLAAAARASGDYAMAVYYEIEAKRREIEIVKVATEAKRLEAEATLRALEIERAALDQSDPLIKQKQAEIDIRIANAKAKLLEANAGKDIIASLEREISLMINSANAQNGDTAARGANTGAIQRQTGALREQVQVLGEFVSLQDLAKRGSQGSSFTDADGTTYTKNAAGQLGSNGVMQGYTISGEQNRLNAFLDGKAQIDTRDAEYIRNNYRVAQENLSLTQRAPPGSISFDGYRSAYAEAEKARRALEALEAAERAAKGQGGVNTNGYVNTLPGMQVGGGRGGGGLERPPTTQTVNVNIGGRTTPVNVASDADAKALTSVLRQLETASGASS